jgi:hypothetical protein
VLKLDIWLDVRERKRNHQNSMRHFISTDKTPGRGSSGDVTSETTCQLPPQRVPA